MRPPTDRPKANVLLYAACGCVVAVIALLSVGGGWRWLVPVPVALGVWLVVKSARAGVDDVEGHST